ncbi:Stp1/IreP family PP2C-type Ser/Thr phosphatase [Paenibacillus sp. GCM10012307]|uniref:Stp1/IreP family PP2C-type Ser/Thr phosphatase n=1 Tax=Paenibacillus roseus TaxID=2798579 RepID=A0A934MRW8_9BACL|nr:Stp1/IreP family PP2C-type Ser/Thr phosphatase [Paenibacillus roseus]MBJ6363308.1 Stp1/IreP family PP2C-type Ser/Thr phosphatase [Paenibacillus roseus]
MITANRSDIGRIRLVNEDQAWVGQQDGTIAIAIVADGMGGHQAGDVASQLAVQTFREALAGRELVIDDGEAAHHVVRAIHQANAVVYDMAAQNEQYHNMGTTVVAAVADKQRAVIAHIGDSRAYKIKNRDITQLTNDHTLVNELAKTGQISAEEAANHPRRNVLTRALGTDKEVEVDVQTLEWAPGETLLLCSDGLSNMVSEQQMVDTVQAGGLNLDAKAEQLVELALRAGGDDNITVVLLYNDADTSKEQEVRIT